MIKSFRLLIIGVLLIVFSGCTEEIKKPIIYESYEQGIKVSSEKEQNMLVVFDLLATSNRHFQELLKIPEVRQGLNNYVVVYLVVDDETNRSNYELQRQMFKSNFQPAYYIVSSEKIIQKGPLGICNSAEFIDFIKFKSEN